MNSLIPANFGGLSTKFQQVQPVDDLSSGIQSSFGLIGYKGKVWSIRYRGDETPLMREDGDGPKSSIEVVILKASQHVSKIWYEQGYVEGSNASPDCFSNNGVTPEATSTNKQCDSCAACPHNQWGSRITPAGKAGKACADSKRLAVVPLIDLPNEAYGGPMLLRVPAASLQDVAMYGQKMQQMGYPYYAIGTRIAFDMNEAFPKFVFSAIRPLNDGEADVVLALRDNHTVERILSESEFSAPAPGPTQEQLNSAFEQPPENTTQVQTTATKSVGDQAREAAAAAAAKAAEDAKKAAAAKKAAEAKAKKEAEAKAKAEAEAAAASQPEESDEDRELREMEERMAALKAKKQAAAASATTQSSAPVTSQVTSSETSDSGPTAQTSASPSDFENELDDMLNSLL